MYLSNDRHTRKFCDSIHSDTGPGHVGFVVDKAELEQVFSEYFSFPCQFLLRQLPHIH
jgi:hypothetical protein